MFNIANRFATARKELKSACAGFNCRYFVDHKKSESCHELFRHDIYELMEGGFEVVKSRCVVGSVSTHMERTVIKRFSHYHLAKEAVDSSVTVLEMDGAEFIDEKTFELENVFNNEIRIPKLLIDVPTGQELTYLENEIVFAQKIPVGFRLFVAINPFGQVFVQASGEEQGGWVEASSAVSNRLDCLKHVEGARGAVLEVVLNNASIEIIDVWFLHDRWLNNLSIRDRHELFAGYCKEHKLNLSVLYGSKTRVSAVSSLAVEKTKALIVEKDGLRYLIKRHQWEMMISSGWKQELTMVDLVNMEKVGSIRGQFLPDISYKTFHAAGQGVESFWY